MEYLEPLPAGVYTPGKHYMCALPVDVDLIAAITSICADKKIETASFSVMGTVLPATIGVFDPQQQVYVTHIETNASEILSCTGIVSQNNGACGLRATILLADQRGGITGGRLFSDTIVLSAELDLQALLNPADTTNGALYPNTPDP